MSVIFYKFILTSLMTGFSMLKHVSAKYIWIYLYSAEKLFHCIAEINSILIYEYSYTMCHQLKMQLKMQSKLIR